MTHDTTTTAPVALIAPVFDGAPIVFDGAPIVLGEYVGLYYVGPWPTCMDCDAMLGDALAGDYDDSRHHVRAGEAWQYHRDRPVHLLCDDCARTCDRCDDTVRADDVVEVDRGHYCATWCRECVDGHAFSCDNCGAVHDDDHMWTHDDVAMCRDCYHDAVRDEERRNAARVIRPYHDTARRDDMRIVLSPWARAHRRHFGVELELEVRDGDRDDIAERMIDAARTWGTTAPALGYGTDVARRTLIHAEEDSSISHGFELITAPCGLDVHRALWPAVLTADNVHDTRSHNTVTCGLHVHVSRTGLSRLTIGKAVAFLNRAINAEFVELVARRAPNGYARAKYEKTARDVRSSDRYEILNVTPRDTIEFRLFRGTTRALSVLAAVEFCHAVLNWCACASVRELRVDGLLAHVFSERNHAETRALRPYILERMAARYGDAWRMTAGGTWRATVARHATFTDARMTRTATHTNTGETEPCA